MANPTVRSKLSFYPQYAAGQVASAKNAFRWLHELDPNLTTPMIQVSNEDFYLFEPCRLRSGQYCIPYHWIECLDEGELKLFGWVWHMYPTTAMDGWVVDIRKRSQVKCSNFLISFIVLKQSFMKCSIPDPGIIHGNLQSLWVKSSIHFNNIFGRSL